MSKLAQVLVGEAASEKLKESQFGGDESCLKMKKKEDEIRIKLDDIINNHQFLTDFGSIEGGKMNS